MQQSSKSTAVGDDDWGMYDTSSSNIKEHLALFMGRMRLGDNEENAGIGSSRSKRKLAKAENRHIDKIGAKNAFGLLGRPFIGGKETLYKESNEELERSAKKYDMSAIHSDDEELQYEGDIESDATQPLMKRLKIFRSQDTGTDSSRPPIEPAFPLSPFVKERSLLDMSSKEGSALLGNSWTVSYSTIYADPNPNLALGAHQTAGDRAAASVPSSQGYTDEVVHWNAAIDYNSDSDSDWDDDDGSVKFFFREVFNRNYDDDCEDEYDLTDEEECICHDRNMEAPSIAEGGEDRHAETVAALARYIAARRAMRLNQENETKQEVDNETTMSELSAICEASDRGETATLSLNSSTSDVENVSRLHPVLPRTWAPVFSRPPPKD